MMGNKVIQQNVVVQAGDLAHAYAESAEQLAAQRHLVACNLNDHELIRGGDEENGGQSSTVISSTAVQQTLPQQRSVSLSDELCKNKSSSSSSSSTSSSPVTSSASATTPKKSSSSTAKSILSTATNFAISPLKDKFFKVGHACKKGY